MNKIYASPVIIPVLLFANAALADSSRLKTQTGNDIGLSVSSYRYQEPGIMSLKGPKIGVDLRIVRVSEEGNNLIFRGELRSAFGTVDYNSEATGSASGEPDWYIEARALAGKDWVNSKGVLSPYAGFGYRYLFNDGRGVSSTGYGGYRRESNYFYFPIGAIFRMALKNQARLESTLEYDQLLAGIQISRLSDVPGYNDATNDQSNGYGLRLGIMYQRDKWAAGPYMYYWNISESNVVPEIKDGVPTGFGLVEPNNNTVEFGFKVSQQF